MVVDSIQVSFTALARVKPEWPSFDSREESL